MGTESNPFKSQDQVFDEADFMESDLSHDETKRDHFNLINRSVRVKLPNLK